MVIRMIHPLGEDYELWCELNHRLQLLRHRRMSGTGRCETCRTCDGSGIDASAVYESPDGGSAVLPVEDGGDIEPYQYASMHPMGIAVPKRGG